MNTQSHAILTFYLLRQILGKRVEQIKHLNPVLFSGAVAPDLVIFVFFVWFTLFEPTSAHSFPFSDYRFESPVSY